MVSDGTVIIYERGQPPHTFFTEVKLDINMDISCLHAIRIQLKKSSKITYYNRIEVYTRIK